MRIALAKWAFYASGWVSRIRYPQRMYDADGIGHIWHVMPTPITYKFITLAMRLGGEHFDHFALHHEKGTTCPECGGRICGCNNFEEE